MPPGTLSLKQRLAALSNAQSSPTAPLGADPIPRSPIGARRKQLFNPSWAKRQGDGVAAGARVESEMVQEVLSKMIFQAGVDFETRPMVVINASALPDPQKVSYDLLLSRILAYLNLYVESDYTVVFFAAGGRHTPGWNWVWKAYRSLSRKYRKNLKRLYIVHSSFFSKMLFSLAGAIISPKFFRKLLYTATLSELAHHVPLTQIDIPPAVYQENLKHERTITLPVPTRSSIFGVPLAELMGYDGEKGSIPRVVKDAIQYLRETGLEEEGLFRRSPQSTMLRAAQDAYDRGNVVSLDTFGDPHLAAVLLKKYLRDLPEPVFPESLYPVIRRCPLPTSDPTDMTSVVYIRETLLPELAPCVYILLSYVLHLMHEVSLRAASNRMDAHNLAIVLCPNLVKGASPTRDVMMCGIPGVQPSRTFRGKDDPGHDLVLCIRRYFEIFDEVRDRSEAVPAGRAQSGNAESSQSSASASPVPRPQSGSFNDDDDDIDDAMLVMPIGPSSTASNGAPPSAWAASGTSTFKPRHRSTFSGGSSSGVRSMHTAVGEPGNSSIGPGFGYTSKAKAKSTISIENGTGTHNKKGSISVGRGTTRKSTGAGVEAISITAEGFFSAPLRRHRYHRLETPEPTV
ncbi:CDC42 rho GTPase-activating protein [Infundibulicybe gibba]|nr:CDC42 rho GTPase-activating protein [Infundibulicybe gibba]